MTSQNCIYIRLWESFSKSNSPGILLDLIMLFVGLVLVSLSVFLLSKIPLRDKFKSLSEIETKRFGKSIAKSAQTYYSQIKSVFDIMKSIVIVFSLLGFLKVYYEYSKWQAKRDDEISRLTNPVGKIIERYENTEGKHMAKFVLQNWNPELHVVFGQIHEKYSFHPLYFVKKSKNLTIHEHSVEMLPASWVTALISFSNNSKTIRELSNEIRIKGIPGTSTTGVDLRQFWHEDVDVLKY